MTHRLLFSARVVALVVATASGVFFVMWFGLLVRLYYIMPGTITRDRLVTTTVLGMTFAVFAIIYGLLARKTKPNSRNTIEMLRKLTPRFSTQIPIGDKSP